MVYLLRAVDKVSHLLVIEGRVGSFGGQDVRRATTRPRLLVAWRHAFIGMAYVVMAYIVMAYVVWSI